MSCPDEAALTVYAEAPQEARPGEGWTRDAVHSHLAECPTCAATVHQVRACLEAFRGVDLVEADRYDDAWMEALAQQVEEQLDGPPGVVVPLHARRQLVPALAVLAAVAAALVVGLWLTTPRAPVTDSEPVATVDPLAEQGRELGRSLLNDALDEVDEHGVLASALSSDRLLDELPDEQWSFQTTIEDELDALTTEELQSLSLRL